jgi:hypothetical protein
MNFGESERNRDEMAADPLTCSGAPAPQPAHRTIGFLNWFGMRPDITAPPADDRSCSRTRSPLGTIAKWNASFTGPCESSSSIVKLRAIIAIAAFDSRNARLRPGQKRGPAPNASDFGALSSSCWLSQRSG